MIRHLLDRRTRSIQYEAERLHLHSGVVQLFPVVPQHVLPKNKPCWPGLTTTARPHIFMILKRLAELAVEVDACVPCLFEIWQRRQILTDHDGVYWRRRQAIDHGWKPQPLPAGSAN